MTSKYAPKNHGSRGKGRAVAWLREHAGYQGDDCLIWPMSTQSGYGMFGYLGKMHYAHRFMCELAHGAPPADRPFATHACGNSRCCNPRHLGWGTPSTNQHDRRRHGTSNKTAKGGKLTWDQAQEIRAAKGKRTQEELAEEYGVHRTAVSAIWRGITWTNEDKGVKRSGRKWGAVIKRDGKNRWLGTFDTKELARAAYRKAAAELSVFDK